MSYRNKSNRNVFLLITAFDIIVALMLFGGVKLVAVAKHNGGLIGISNINLILISLVLGFLFVVVVFKIRIKWL
jgi:hypothetical protein